MINSVEINNFKAIKTISFSLDRFNIFIGANNSGKSSVLQAIQFAVGTAQTARKHGRNLDHASISFSASASLFSYLPIKDIGALVYNKALTQTQGCTIKLANEDDETIIEFKRGKNRNIATTMSNSFLLRQLMSAQPYCVITPGVSGISISEEYKTKAVVLKSATRGDSNLYLRNILYLLSRQGISWNCFIEKFHLFFPNYEVLVLFDEDLDETIEVFAKTENGVTLPIDALGTSVLQILQILSYIYYFDPQMLILDEPDTHLHPNNQRKLISVLNDISGEKNLQILLSTHSRHMLDEATAFAKFFWMQNGSLCKEISECDNPDYLQMMLDLGALDKSDFLINRNIKWVICTEDAKVDKENMLKSVLSSSGYDLSECVIIPYKGCGKIESVVLLSNFIHQFIPDAKIIVHRDRDYLDDEQINNLLQKFAEQNITLWVTPQTDIEAIFVNSSHIKFLYPTLSEEYLDQIISEARAESRETSIEKFVNYVSNLGERRNYRAINIECERKYDSSPERYSYGKKTLGLVKSKLQEKIHSIPNLFHPSTIIDQQELRGLL